MTEVRRSLNLPDVIIIEPKVFKDSRGLFFESFQAKRYAEYGISENFVQDNFSVSTRNVVRGLHYQKNQTQGKLIFTAYGQILDVAVDIRRDSPTFGQWTSVILDDQSFRQIYIPPGFAHGFCVLSDSAGFFYKCTDYYDPSSEISVLWNDPDLGITWPIKDPIISPKDQNGLKLSDINPDDLTRWIPS